ncbi:hypothetical protein EXIGLDRAFT_691930 [Exidia glandulosa HHB12029]|uniref:Uncharacterized protein n=1 Tax=Exidia glandulosa HHB12029 TaxID=1314781 RepID=A0A165IBC9_EXIGL|nr:hypothetical protein EXIGLDRAFT_691930 [Exidia glandulosa HHB12029]
MNISETSSEYYTRTLSSTPIRLARPTDTYEAELAQALPFDIHAAAYQRDARVMERHANKKRLQGEPDGDRGSDDAAPSARTSKAPEPAHEPPSRMPAGKKTAQPAGTRRTRQQSVLEGVDPPVFELPPARKTAQQKPSTKDPKPLLALPGPSPPVVPLASRIAKTAAPARPSLFQPPARKPATSLFGPTQLARAPSTPPRLQTKSKKASAREVEEDEDEDELEYVQDADADMDWVEGPDLDNDEHDVTPNSPTVEHVKRRVAKKAAPAPKKVAPAPKPKNVAAPAPRSTRFSVPAPAHIDDVDDDDADEDVFGEREEVVYEEPRGKKRGPPPRKSGVSREEGASPPHKRTTSVFDHIVPGYEGDSRVSMVPDCVREIVEGGFKIYLPMHYFSLDVLKQEEDARVGLRPGESLTVRLPPPTVPESQASASMWMQWAKRMLKVLEILHVPAFVVKMFTSHFDHIFLANDLTSAWIVWRYYDIARRQQFKGDHPYDISRLDRTLLADMRDRVTTELHERMEASMSRSRPSTQAPAAKTKISSTSTQEPRASGSGTVLKLRYTRCMICGSHTHVYEKDVVRKDCPPKWLAPEVGKNTFKCPDTNAYVCWLFNGTAGCSKSTCRHKKDGHRCSLCGSTAHGCHGCA